MRNTSATAAAPACAPAPLLPPLAPHFVLAAQARVHDRRIPIMAALSDTGRQLLHVLLGQCPKDDPASLAPISRARLAEKIGKSMPTVDRALRELVDATLIERLPQYEPGQRRHGKPHPVVPTKLTEQALGLLGLSPMRAVSQPSEKTSSSPQGQAAPPVDKQPEPKPADSKTWEETRTPTPLRPLLAVMSGPQVWHLAGLASRAGGQLEDILARMKSAILAARKPFNYLRKLVLCGRTWTSPTLPEKQEAAATERQAARAAADDAVTGFLASAAGQWLVNGDQSVLLQVQGTTCEEHRNDGRRWQARLLNPSAEVPRVIAAMEAGRLHAIDDEAARAIVFSPGGVCAACVDTCKKQTCVQNLHKADMMRSSTIEEGAWTCVSQVVSR